MARRPTEFRELLARYSARSRTVLKHSRESESDQRDHAAEAADIAELRALESELLAKERELAAIQAGQED